MLTTAVSRARRRTKSTIAGSSMTGLVSGMQTSVVTPPAAAASLAVFKVSRCSAPGSPVKARISTRPGARTRPVQSTTVAPSGGAVVQEHAAVPAPAGGWVDEVGVGEEERGHSILEEAA